MTSFLAFPPRRSSVVPVVPGHAPGGHSILSLLLQLAFDRITSFLLTVILPFAGPHAHSDTLPYLGWLFFRLISPNLPFIHTLKLGPT